MSALQHAGWSVGRASLAGIADAVPAAPADALPACQVLVVDRDAGMHAAAMTRTVRTPRSPRSMATS